MKKYKEFMDGVKAPDTLRQRLTELETPEKRPIPWKRYGAMAAALALVCGLGGLGAWAMRANSLDSPIPPYPSGYQGTQPENIDVPDIAQVDPGDLTEPGQRTLGGYDVTVGSGPEAMVAHYILPYIEYGEAGNPSQVALDWDIPQGAHKRDLSQEEIVALMGGKDALSTHLDWDGYTLTGWGAWYEDGSFWGAYINGYAGPMDHFEFAVTADQLPPTCVVYSASVTQEVRGLTITADGYDSVATPSGGVDASSRRVSFMKDGYGFRFDLTGVSRALTEERVSRLVRQIADKGLELTYDCPYCGHTFPFGAVHHDPLVSAEGGYTCSNCGQFVPAGEKHSHTFVGEGEIPEFVPDYDPTYEDGLPGYDSNCPYCADGTVHTHPYDPAGPVSVSDAPAASEEICGYPLAPDTHVCEVCGQTLPAGVEHSHQEDHHQEHHSGHH